RRITVRREIVMVHEPILGLGMGEPLEGHVGGGSGAAGEQRAGQGCQISGGFSWFGHSILRHALLPVGRAKALIRPFTPVFAGYCAVPTRNSSTRAERPRVGTGEGAHSPRRRA